MATRKKVFASFLIAPPSSGRGLCATTRAADRGERGRIGLPGGKVDPGEDPAHAALREAAEEGWQVNCDPDDLALVHLAKVDGRLVAWYEVPPGVKGVRKAKFKEKGRIRPVTAPRWKIAASGYGNEFLDDPFGEYLADLKGARELERNPGHTIKLPADTLKLKMVELWRTGRTMPAAHYERMMNHYLDEYRSRTGRNIAGNVGDMWRFEQWYDKLSKSKKDAIRKKVTITKANPKRLIGPRQRSLELRHKRPAGTGLKRRKDGGGASRSKQLGKNAYVNLVLYQGKKKPLVSVQFIKPRKGYKRRYATDARAKSAYNALTSQAKVLAWAKRHKLRAV